MMNSLSSLYYCCIAACNSSWERRRTSVKSMAEASEESGEVISLSLALDSETWVWWYEFGADIASEDKDESLLASDMVLSIVNPSGIGRVEGT
jgi:hypothetical protein